jgi:hypothetical protein
MIRPHTLSLVRLYTRLLILLLVQFPFDEKAAARVKALIR